MPGIGNGNEYGGEPEGARLPLRSGRRAITVAPMASRQEPRTVGMAPRNTPGRLRLARGPHKSKIRSVDRAGGRRITAVDLLADTS
jgi:hypothetical protein